MANTETDALNDSDITQNYRLNKSASFSGSPIAEKYEIKQLFKNKEGETFVHHYTYEIPDRRRLHIHQTQHLYKFNQVSTSKGKFIQASDYNFMQYEGGVKTEVPNVKFGSTFKHTFNFAKHVPEEQGFEKFLTHNKSDSTPMDIDTSLGSDKSICSPSSQKNDKLQYDTSLANEKSMTDVHHDDTENLTATRHKSKVPKLTLKPKNSVNILNTMSQDSRRGINNNVVIRFFKILCFFFIPVILGLVCMFCNSDSVFIETFDSQNIVDNLKILVYGQQNVIDKLEYNLQIIKNNKVFLFTGGTGVGKTYTAQIIERNFPFKNNIQKIIMHPQMQYAELEKEVINNVVTNGLNLIIFDDVAGDDVYFLLPIMHELSASGTRFIMIIIVNVQEMSADMSPATPLKIKGREISKVLYDNNIVHSTFMFDNLNAEDTKECIRYAMINRNITASEDKVNNVLDKINYKYSGCKGVYGKVAVFNYF